MATPPLHLAILSSLVPAIARPLHLPNLQQSFLQTLQLKNPLPFAHGRETIQVPSPGMWQGVQCQE